MHGFVALACTALLRARQVHLCMENPSCLASALRLSCVRLAFELRPLASDRRESRSRDPNGAIYHYEIVIERSHLVRAEPGDYSGMSQHKQRVPSLLTQAEEDSLTAVHRWLKRHRRQVLSLCENADAPWVTLARRMEAEGILNKAGHPPSPDSIRMTWKTVVARHEKKAKALAAKKTGEVKRLSWRRPNVEPPSRPPPAYNTIRYPSPLTAEPPGWRERYVLQNDPAAPHPMKPPPLPPASSPQAAGSASSPGASNPRRRQSTAEQLAELDRLLRLDDGYQPTPRIKGRSV